MKIHYDCSKCPGYCCSYPRIQVKKKDVERLAEHFGMTKSEVERRFTRKDPDDVKKNGKQPRIVRHTEDVYFGTICIFFDQNERCCSVYEARPKTCRSYPGLKRCGYYDFLRFERRVQRDPEYIALTTR